jgi:hypothetical protein
MKPVTDVSRSAASKRSPAEPARSQEDAQLRAPKPGAAAVLAPVVVATAIGLIFVAVYLAAFHAPTPHHLPVAAVGSVEKTQSLTRALNREVPDGFAVERLPSAGAARVAIGHHDIYAAVVYSGNEATLLYAGANGPPTADLLRKSVGGVLRAEGVSLEARDVLPAAPGDARRLSIFYAAFGLVLAGFLFGTLTFQVAPRLQLRRRLLSLAAFGVTGGVLITLIAKSFGAMPGPFPALAGVIALMATASAAASMASVRLLGRAGVPLASVVLLILGNSTSGGSLPTSFLPPWLHPLSEILPVGVGVRALDGLAYFQDDGAITALAVLSGWIVFCVAALAARETAQARRRQTSSPSGGPWPSTSRRPVRIPNLTNQTPGSNNA